MKKKAIVFDMDGVIVDSEPLYIKLQVDFLSLIGYDVTADQIASMVGASGVAMWEFLRDVTNNDFSEEEYGKLYDEYYIAQNIDYADYLKPGLREILQWLLEKNIPIALASSSSPEVIEEILNDCGIKDYFFSIVSGYNFKESKPNPEIYLYSCEALGFLPGECVAVEDSNIGIEAAKRAGMLVLAVEENRFNFSQEAADKIIKKYDEIKTYF